jgi:hypothetical protein
MFIRLNLKDYGRANVGVVFLKLFVDIYIYYYYYYYDFLVLGTHPWSLSKYLHTPCRLRFNTSWVSCSQWAVDVRQVWFVSLWRRLGQRDEGVVQLCIHGLTETKNVSALVYFYVAAATLIVCCVYQVPWHVLSIRFSDTYCLSGSLTRTIQLSQCY